MGKTVDEVVKFAKEHGKFTSSAICFVVGFILGLMVGN